MAVAREFLAYSQTITVAGRDFYEFRLGFLHPTYADILEFILGNEATPLAVLDLPSLLPDSIASGTTFNHISGGLWILPETVYYAFSKVNSFHEAISPNAPIEADVVIQQAFLESCFVYYVDEPPFPSMPLPGDNDPADYEPEGNWYYPPYGDFGFAAIVVAQRSVGFQTASHLWRYAWVYSGCTLDPLHIHNHLGDASQGVEGVYTWTSAYYIDCCNVGESSGYLIEAGGSGGSTFIQLWVFSTQNEVARHFHSALLPVSTYPSIPMLEPYAIGLGIMLGFLGPGDNILGAMLGTMVGRIVTLRPKHLYKGISTQGKGLSTQGKGICTKL